MNPASIRQEHLFPPDVAAPIPSWLRGSMDPPSLKPLRPFQVASLDAVRASLKAGNKRVVLKAPTGAGKTVLAAHIIQSALGKGRRAWFIVNAISLVDQTVEKFWEAGIRSIGVTQADHEMTDTRQPVQVCSVQTLSRRDLASMVPPDLILIDECHNWFQFYVALFAAFPEVPIIGLSATPYTKGLGKHYQDLIIASSTRELIGMGFLSPFVAFAPGKKADLSKVRIQGEDYHEGDLAEAMNQPDLVADVVQTWLKYAEQYGRRPTLCYAVDRAHARKLQEQFLAAGVPCGYMDANTELEERRVIGEQFARREIEVVTNVGVLTTGIDWDVRCIILDRPTKSAMLFQQIIGRGLRTADGKDFCLVLDHSPTHAELGEVTDVDDRHLELDDGKKKASSIKPRKERLPTECPSCHRIRPANSRKCPTCGFAPVKQSEIENIEGELVEFQGKGERATPAQKRQFFAELRFYAQLNGKKEGWASWKFKDRFGAWPPFKWRNEETCEPSPETLSWIKSRNIAWAKRRTP